MYTKIFQQILRSSIASDYEVRHLFMDILVLADKNGVVDQTYEAIARQIGLPVEKVINGIAELMKPDPESRSKDFEGARLVLLDPHRTWGWKVINYRKYRNLQYDDGDKRRTRQREWIARKRASIKSRQVSTDVDGSRQVSIGVDKGKSQETNNEQLPLSTVDGSLPYADAEAEANTLGISTPKSEKVYGAAPKKSKQPLRLKPLNGLTDSEWIAQLSNDSTYAGVDVHREFGKMANWCKATNKVPTRRRFINWLNRTRPMSGFDPDESDDQGPDGWRAVARELFPNMHFPESFWDIQSPEVIERIEARLAG